MSVWGCDCCYFLQNPSDEGFVTDITRDDNELDDNTLGDAISFDAKSSFQEEQTDNQEDVDDNNKYNPDIWNFLASSSEVESTENNSSTSSSFEKEVDLYYLVMNCFLSGFLLLHSIYLTSSVCIYVSSTILSLTACLEM